LETELAEHENPRPFGGLVIPHAGDISIVQRMGTFLLWYDKIAAFLLTILVFRGKLRSTGRGTGW
jgi:hypothetical protein